MKCSVHTLELHRDIPHPADGPAPDGTQAVFQYRSAVAGNDLEPDECDHLAGNPETATIRTGHYLFAQAQLPAQTAANAEPGQAEAALFRAAAKEVWLESLWREVQFKDDRILVRILSEDGHSVFQIFRAIEAPEA